MLVLSLPYWVPKNRAVFRLSKLMDPILKAPIVFRISNCFHNAGVTKRSTVNDSRSFRAGVRGFESLLPH